PQLLDQVDGGRFTDVIGVRLEGEAKDADRGAVEGAQMALDLANHARSHGPVDLEHRLQQRWMAAMVLGHLRKRADVLGEAGAAKPDTRLQELRANAGIEAHTL